MWELVSPVVGLFGVGQPPLDGLIEQLPELHPGPAVLTEEPHRVSHLGSKVTAQLHVEAADVEQCGYGGRLRVADLDARTSTGRELPRE